MADRLKLHQELISLLGSNNVYFQPPESVKLTYPCIVYKRSNGSTKYANDMPYNYQQSYSLTYITDDPDSNMITRLAYAFKTIRFDRHYTSDNLNHDVFTLYY